MHAVAHGLVRTHVRESALKVDSGRKILCRTGESNLQALAACRSDALPTELHSHPGEKSITEELVEIDTRYMRSAKRAVTQSGVV